MVEEIEGSVREAWAAAAVGVVDSALAEIQREVGAERKRTLGETGSRNIARVTERMSRRWCKKG